jgi:hypothetical protein
VASAGQTTPRPKVSPDDFKKLQQGMTVAGAEGHMGCPGKISMQTSLLGSTNVTYDWPIGGNVPGTMSAVFTDGRLTLKSYVAMRRL